MRKRVLPALAAAAAVAVGLSASAHADPSVPDQTPQAGLTEQQITDLENRLFAMDQPYNPQTDATAQAPQGADTAATGKLNISERQAMDVNYGLGAIGTMHGTDDQIMVHSLGIVTRQTADGEIVWRHTPSEFYDDWQITASGRFAPEPSFRISVGPNSIGLGSGSLDRGYAVGDLNGDGTDDVAVIAQVGIDPYRPFTAPGETLPYGTFVTVLDGRTGGTVWHKLTTYARQVLISDGTMILSNTAYGNDKAPAALTAKVTAYTFASSGEALTATEKWSFDTGSHTAVFAALEQAGDGRVAVGWNERSVKDKPTDAHLALLDTASGKAAWSVATPQIPRTVRYDATRDVVVATEQMGFTQGVQYDLTTYTAAAGTRRVLSSRVNALVINLLVADVAGSRKAEYVVSESLLDPYQYAASSQVRATDGDGSQLWTYTLKRDPANPKDGPIVFDLDAAEGTVVATWLDDSTRGMSGMRDYNYSAGITAIDGRDGDVSWEEQGTKSSPMMSTITGGRHPEVVTVAADQTRYTYRVSGGRVDDKTATLGELSSAVAYDVNGDGVKDLVAGGSAHGVFAIDGTTVNANPHILWRAQTPGSVHDIKLGDVRGDSRPEVVVEAENATVVLDVRDGDEKAEVDSDGLVWTVALANIDRDGNQEILVPTDGLRAYDGDGDRLWTYGAKDTRVFSTVSVNDGTVYATYGTKAGSGADQEAVQVALDGRRGKEKWAVRQDPAAIVAPQLWNGVLADPRIPYADGHAVVSAWTSTGDAINGHTIVDIRDGRTGELVMRDVNGGLWTHNQFIAGDEGLVQVHAVVFSLFDGSDTAKSTLLMPNPHQAVFTTGPNGEHLIVSANDGSLSTWDTSILQGTRQYPSENGKSPYGLDVRGVFADDLNGDGTPELIGLGGDQAGYDLVLGLTGFGAYQSNMNRHGIGVYTITNA